MSKKTEGAGPLSGCLPFPRIGGTAPKDTLVSAPRPDGLDVHALVDLCRMLDVPVGYVAGVADTVGRDEDDANRALKREMLELNRAYASIASPAVRQTLLQLVKAAAR